MPSPSCTDAAGFGPALARARRRAGLTQVELAKRLGTTQAAVTRLETGRFLPAVRTLCRLARALDVEFEIGPGGLTIHSSRRRPPTLAELRARRDEILEVAASNRARNVRVFGSVARGEATPDSDIDFLVEFEPGASLMDLSGLHLDLEALLGRPVHVAELPMEPALERERWVIERIEREAVPL